MKTHGYLMVSLLGAMALGACTGTDVARSDLSASPIVLSSEGAPGVSASPTSAIQASEVASTAPVSSESEYAAFIEIWGEEGAQALAKGAGIEVRQVPELLNNQGKRIELTEKLQAKFPEDLTTVWAIDKMQKDIHVSAKTQEVLDYAKKLNPSVQTHLTKYSYKEMEEINDKLHELLYDQLGVQDNPKSFAGFDPIGATIHLGLDGLTDKQKESPAYKEIQKLMDAHSDLIKPSTDYETWGPGEAEAA